MASVALVVQHDPELLAVLGQGLAACADLVARKRRVDVFSHETRTVTVDDDALAQGARTRGEEREQVEAALGGKPVGVAVDDMTTHIEADTLGHAAVAHAEGHKTAVDDVAAVLLGQIGVGHPQASCNHHGLVGLDVQDFAVGTLGHHAAHAAVGVLVTLNGASVVANVTAHIAHAIENRQHVGGTATGTVDGVGTQGVFAIVGDLIGHLGVVRHVADGLGGTLPAGDVARVELHAQAVDGVLAQGLVVHATVLGDVGHGVVFLGVAFKAHADALEPVDDVDALVHVEVEQLLGHTAGAHVLQPALELLGGGVVAQALLDVGGTESDLAGVLDGRAAQVLHLLEQADGKTAVQRVPGGRGAGGTRANHDDVGLGVPSLGKLAGIGGLGLGGKRAAGDAAKAGGRYGAGAADERAAVKGRSAHGGSFRLVDR